MEVSELKNVLAKLNEKLDSIGNATCVCSKNTRCYVSEVSIAVLKFNLIMLGDVLVTVLFH